MLLFAANSQSSCAALSDRLISPKNAIIAPINAVIAAQNSATSTGAISMRNNAAPKSPKIKVPTQSTVEVTNAIASRNNRARR